MFSKSYKIGTGNSRRDNSKIREKHFSYINEENNNGLSEKNKEKICVDIPLTDTSKNSKAFQCNSKTNVETEITSSVHMNPAFDESPKSKYFNCKVSNLTSSRDSLNLDDRVVYNTVLRIDEDESFVDPYDSDTPDGAASSKDANSTKGFSAASTDTMFEQEDTLSLLYDGEVNKRHSLNKRDSRHSIYDDHKKQFNFMDAVERRISLTHEAGEKIVHKILDHHFEKYEEIPKENNCDNSELNNKKCRRVIKNGQILSTGPNGKCANSSIKDKCCCCCGIKAKFIGGVLCVLVGILTTIWTPAEFLMRERLRMIPGLPAFDWWAEPPDDIYLRIYLFNFTNNEKFLSGEDTKLDIQEIGPIVYKEKLKHSNFTFNDNYTLTYTAHRWAEFQPELNTHIDLNATITVPNLPILGFASYLHDTNYFIKNAFNIIVKTKGSRPFVKITLYDYLFNFRDPVMETARTFIPQIVPISNMGMLSTMYLHPVDTVTVYIGPKWGDEKFFTIDYFNGHTALPGFLYTPSCKESVVGSSEGVLYRQKITKNTTLLYWRKTLCKVMKLYFEEEQIRNGVLAYKFSIPHTAYHRTYNKSNPDCFSGDPPLPNGLSDISRCFFDFPMALSLPHFLGTDPSVMERITGLSPDPDLHNSYLVVEPSAGIPIVSVARSQINLVVRKIQGFNKEIQQFSDLTVPMFWAEYSQLVLPNYVWALMIAQLKYVPVIQVIISVFLIILGFFLMYTFFKQIIYPLCCPKSFRQHKNLNNLARNTIMSYEHEKKQPNTDRT